MSKEQETIVGRRKFLNRSVMAAAGMSCLGSWSKTIGALTHHGPLSSQSQAAVHNMLIIGERTTYLYHLPMFSFTTFVSPHRYQVILEVSFGAEIKDRYLRDMKENPGTKFYTFNPDERFVLTDLRKSRDSFKGTIFRNHLEKWDGKAILRDVVAKVTSVLHFEEFSLRPRRLPRLEYLVFGNQEELFLAHVLTGPPDFDQILSVKIPNGVFSDEALAKVPHIVIPRKNGISQRLQSNQLSVIGSEKGFSASLKASFKIVATRENYLEEGELRPQPEFATTPIEAAAEFP